MGFGAALLVVLSFVESQLGGAPLVAAIAGAALVMVTGGVLRVSALWVSSQAATRVKVATIERAFESAETPVELPKGT
jgi:hypothetical protein